MARGKGIRGVGQNLGDALFRLEPELRLLEGVLTTLRLLGEPRDAVEPIALAALARCGTMAIDDLKSGLREAMEAAGIDADGP